MRTASADCVDVHPQISIVRAQDQKYCKVLTKLLDACTKFWVGYCAYIVYTTSNDLTQSFDIVPALSKVKDKTHDLFTKTHMENNLIQRMVDK